MCVKQILQSTMNKIKSEKQENPIFSVLLSIYKKFLYRYFSHVEPDIQYVD